MAVPSRPAHSLKIRVWNPHCIGYGMKSEHIDNRTLYEIVMENAVLDEAEAEHLKACMECMQVVRVLVRQNLSHG
jgi:hypothetical protein